MAYLGVDGNVGIGRVRAGGSAQDIIAPGEPGGQGGRGKGGGDVCTGDLRIPDMGSPLPEMPVISNARGSAGDFALKLAKSPVDWPGIVELASIDIPNVITL